MYRVKQPTYGRFKRRYHHPLAHTKKSSLAFTHTHRNKYTDKIRWACPCNYMYLLLDIGLSNKLRKARFGGWNGKKQLMV